MRTEAKRCLGELLVAAGRPQEGIRQFEEVLQLIADTDARVSRLWAGPHHIRALLAVGRGDEARAGFEAYAAMVAECQSPLFTQEAAKLRELLGSA
jgi:hypothetical protein